MKHTQKYCCGTYKYIYFLFILRRQFFL